MKTFPRSIKLKANPPHAGRRSPLLNARRGLRLALVLGLFFRVAASPVAVASDTNDAALKIPVVTGPEIWKDPAQPIAARVRDLVSRLTLQEKVSQLLANPPAIGRLGIPAYSHRNECLHGVADAGVATVFPQVIGMAATWDVPLIRREAEVIATEARAKHNDYVARHHGNTGEHFGLNFYAPNLNLVRDPRWGRGQETYGEDPFLTAQMGVAFIKGLQGDDPKYVEVLACAKHFAVHSGPEALRHCFDAWPPVRDLYDTYLPAFEAAVREGHVGSVMGAYSALYGIPDCANHFLLTELLRDRWGFKGVVFSDGGAIGDIWAAHHYVATPEAAAVAAVQAGCDVSSGGMAGEGGGAAFKFLVGAVTNGLISEKDVDAAVRHELTARFRLGMFDPPAMVPWSQLGLGQVDTPAHRALALKVAEESIVLLKNSGVLPLDRARIKRLAVIGPNADSGQMLLGNYHGTPSRSVTILEGIKRLAGPTVEVAYAPGCPLALRRDGSNSASPAMTARALALAKSSDAVIFVGGLTARYESEESRWPNQFMGFEGGDRTRIELPAPQEELLKKLYATGKPVVLVNCSGSAMAMPWEAGHLAAIVQAWYPGEEGGLAVAEVLFGEVNPAGRLPITFYRSTKDLPPFEDYSMSNRTYRYFRGRPLFAFGHGLSYTRFDYARAALDGVRFTAAETLELAFTVKNTGKRGGDEVPQVYFRQLHPPPGEPQLALCGFTRVHLAPGQAARITLTIPAERFRRWDEVLQRYVVAPGDYELLIGAASDDLRLRMPFKIVRCPDATLQMPRPGDPEKRTGDEIVAAGQFFHTGTRVVLWMDPGGYDAYRVERRFSPYDQSDWQSSRRENPRLFSPNRFDLRDDTLTPEQIEEVRGGAWPLPLLQKVVDQFVIHFDVDGTSRECFRTLHDVRNLSVHFLLDVDGTIYQTLDLQERAWHATTSNNRSIGIEIANPGAWPVGAPNPLNRWYVHTNGQTILTIPDAFGAAGVRTPGFVGHPARPEPIVGRIQGQELVQYDFTPQQYQALIKLTAALCRIFPKIQCRYPTD
ncbi:MAG TPA: glycoside hydrolase family 3 C-terminal domain-containing protein, partial [Verrucomicrobiae bacterium]|nr:glycoside hydrolase family 3 C-terminal domain-containing protein [Verrucomicrobiae bacterium]